HAIQAPKRGVYFQAVRIGERALSHGSFIHEPSLVEGVSQIQGSFGDASEQSAHVGLRRPLGEAAAGHLEVKRGAYRAEELDAIAAEQGELASAIPGPRHFQ